MLKKSSKRLSVPARSGISILTLMALVMGMLGITAQAASATNITPTGLTKLTFAAGSFLTVNTGLSTEQNFDLGPSSGVECADGVQNNDVAPLGTVGSGGGTDGLWDYYPTDGSRDIVAGTATGGSTTTVVDSTATWTTNQFAGDSVWLTAGPGGNATTPPGAHIASNTATTLTLTAAGTSTPNPTAGFTTAAGAGSVYHVSLADPECVSALDDSETAAGLQPKENVVIVATVNADGTTSIPKTVRTSEVDAETNGGIYFPPAYIPDSTEGVIQASIQPAPTAAPATPFAGTINIDTGAVAMPINIRIQLQGGSGLTALGTGCYVPSSASSAGIPLNLQTGTTNPPAPNSPITGVPFNTHNGRFTAVDNSFAVGGAGSSCALANLGASSINTAFGLPAAAGANTASFVLQTSPALNYNGPADAGPDQFVHYNSTVTLDGSQSFNDPGDPITSYSWAQTGGPTVVLNGANTVNPTFTSDPTDATYTFALTVTTAASSSTDSVTINNSANIAPVANAGPDQSGLAAGTVVTLAGSASDANNDPLTTTWTQVANGAPTVTLSNPNVLRPTFTVPPVTSPSGFDFEFVLSASDAFGGTGTDQVGIGAVASTPTVAVAKARSGGTCSNFCTGDVVTLSANITNPDGTNAPDYTYVWSQTGGRTTALSSTSVSNPTYSLPSSGAAPTTAACTSGTGAVSPTSANCPTYTVTVTKTNTGKSSAPAALAAYSSTLPTRPVANAGAAQTRGPSRLTTLNGTASTQANGHTISYLWSQTAGDPVTLSSTTVASPTFTTPATQETLTFSLIVTDTQSPITGNGTNGNTSTASTTNVVVSADQVIADAGPDQTGKVAGNTVTLTAAASTDPDGLPLSYTWQQLSGPAVTLSSTTVVSPTFVVPPVTNPTGYTWTFTVTATNGNPGSQNTNTDATPVTITAVPSVPTVAAPTKARAGGTCTNFCIGDLVTLSDVITNPDGVSPANYTYAWVQTGGRTTALSDPTAAHPTYILPPSGVAPGNSAVCTSGTGAVSPTSANCPTYKVTVTDTVTNKTSAQSATLAAYGSTLPARPVANAGTAQTVSTLQAVTLNGTASAQTNGHPLSYLWTQTGGTATVTLSDPTVASPTFTAPPNADALVFSLVVTDTQSGIVGGANGNVSTAATVNITVNADQVTADAGPDQLGTHAGDMITLTAAASSDLSNAPLSYTWQQLSGPTVTLVGGSTVSPTFVVPAVTTPTGDTFTFTVTATNGGLNPGDTNTDQTPVTVTSVPSTPVAGTPAIARSGGTCADFCTGDVITLSDTITNPDGTNAADYSYAWVQTGGRTTALSDPTAAQPTFVLPPSGAGAGNTDACTSGTDPVDPSSANCPTYALTVTNNNTNAVSLQSASLPAYSSTLPDQPVADAGGNQAVNALESVTLNGSGTQAQGHPLSYAWTQTGGATVTLSDPTAAAPTFTAPATPDNLTFSLVVTDTQSGIAGNGPNGNTSVADSVTVAVAPSTISGTITDSSSNPVAGASVKAFSSTDTTTPSFTATTAADGTYTLPVSPNTYDIEVVGPNGSNYFTNWYIDSPTRGSATGVIVSDSDVSNVDVQLASGGEIDGTVTNSSSAPVAGVTVYLVAPTDTYVPTAVTTTAADGTYAFHTVTPNSYAVLFGPPTSSGYAGQWYHGAATRAAATPVTISGSNVVAGVDAQLASAGSITGVVTKGGSTPVAGVTVQLFAPSDQYLPSITATTAADGTYTFSGLATGSYNVHFSPPASSQLVAEWYNKAATRTTAANVSVTSGPAVHVNADLAGAGTITGTVLDSHGNPVAGVSVWGYAPADLLAGSVTAVTAANGTYTLSVRTPGTFKVRFAKTGFVTQWYHGVATRAAGATVSVPNATPVTGISATLVASP